MMALIHDINDGHARRIRPMILLGALTFRAPTGLCMISAPQSSAYVSITGMSTIFPYPPSQGPILISKPDYNTYLKVSGGAYESIRTFDSPEVRVCLFSLASHTGISRLDGVGGAVLLVSNLVLSPHL